jgi:hypothetical protein
LGFSLTVLAKSDRFPIYMSCEFIYGKSFRCNFSKAFSVLKERYGEYFSNSELIDMTCAADQQIDCPAFASLKRKGKDSRYAKPVYRIPF